jgi:hypothetical protein
VTCREEPKDKPDNSKVYSESATAATIPIQRMAEKTGEKPAEKGVTENGRENHNSGLKKDNKEATAFGIIGLEEVGIEEFRRISQEFYWSFRVDIRECEYFKKY